MIMEMNWKFHGNNAGYQNVLLDLHFIQGGSPYKSSPIQRFYSKFLELQPLKWKCQHKVNEFFTKNGT